MQWKVVSPHYEVYDFLCVDLTISYLFVAFTGMYRGEPPEEYFSGCGDWNMLGPSSNKELVNRVGASSTSPQILQWASTYGSASDGKPAFISSDTITRDKLSSYEHKEHYILGRVDHMVGYFHVETPEAYRLMLKRSVRRLNKLKFEIDCGSCCCFPTTTLNNMKQELKEAHEIHKLILERSAATRPYGHVGGPNHAKFQDSGVWLYPPALWLACGGACGGNVALQAGPAGGGCGVSFAKRGNAVGGSCGHYYGGYAGSCGVGGGGGCGGGGCGGGGCGG